MRSFAGLTLFVLICTWCSPFVEQCVEQSFCVASTSCAAPAAGSSCAARKSCVKPLVGEVPAEAEGVPFDRVPCNPLMPCSQIAVDLALSRLECRKPHQPLVMVMIRSFRSDPVAFNATVWRPPNA